MNKHACEEQLALYVSGDLAPSESNQIQKHLITCDSCKKRLHEFELCAEMLGSLREEPAEGDLLEIRRQIMSGVQQRRPIDWRWKWCGALAAPAAAIILVLQLVRPAPSHKSPLLNLEPRIEMQPEPRIWTFPSLEATHAAHNVRRHPPHGLASLALITPPGAAPLIRMNTSDPNVVILLQTADMRSDERKENDE